MNIEEEIGVEERLVTPRAVSREPLYEYDLRPKRLVDYIGQEPLRKSLDIFIRAAKGRGEPLDHVLFHGFPGLGKTTLSHIIANEMDAGIKVTSGPVIERQGDLAAILTSLQEGDILFIDEIHRLNHAVEEILYPAMEDFQLDLIIGQGPGARSVRMDLPRFTLVGATTRTGLLTPRCVIVLGLSFAWNCMPLRNWSLLFSGRPSSSGCGLMPVGPLSLDAGPAAPPGLPIGCCGGCGILPRSGITRSLMPGWRTRP